jgi:hypothetical protein
MLGKNIGGADGTKAGDVRLPRLLVSDHQHLFQTVQIGCGF